MKCKCGYKNNPPEADKCLFCGEKVKISRDKRKMRHIFKKHRIPLSRTTLWIGTYAVSLSIPNHYRIGLDFINEIKQYFHGRQFELYSHGNGISIEIRLNQS